MNISSPITEYNALYEALNPTGLTSLSSSDQKYKILNAAVRVASYAAMFFAAAATVAASVAIGLSAPVLGGAIALAGLSCTVLLYDTYQTTKHIDANPLHAGQHGHDVRSEINDLFNKYGFLHIALSAAKVETGETYVFKHIVNAAIHSLI